jgi:hypothetical protein
VHSTVFGRLYERLLVSELRATCSHGHGRPSSLFYYGRVPMSVIVSVSRGAWA